MFDLLNGSYCFVLTRQTDEVVVRKFAIALIMAVSTIIYTIAFLLFIETVSITTGGFSMRTALDVVSATLPPTSSMITKLAFAIFSEKKYHD